MQNKYLKSPFSSNSQDINFRKLKRCNSCRDENLNSNKKHCCCDGPNSCCHFQNTLHMY